MVDWVKLGTILNAIILILIGIQVLNVRIPIPNFEDKSYDMYTLNSPLPIEIIPKFNVSPLYFVEITATTPQNAHYNDVTEFTIKTNDKGKNHIKNTRFEAFVVDSIGRVRGIYPDPAKNTSGNDMMMDEQFKLRFQPPSLDQKVIGEWKLYTYLFNRDNGELASYGIYEFSVAEESGSLNYYLGIIMIILVLSTVFNILRNLLPGLLKDVWIWIEQIIRKIKNAV